MHEVVLCRFFFFVFGAVGPLGGMIYVSICCWREDGKSQVGTGVLQHPRIVVE